MKALAATAVILAALTAACAGAPDHTGTDALDFGGAQSPTHTGQENAATAAAPAAFTPPPPSDEAFNDSNHVHLAEAQRIGIAPLTDLRSFWRPGRPLVRIATCSDFVVDRLTHSEPYLVPEAAAMVHEIGRRFRDTLADHREPDHRIKITSVLRTPESVRRLRRVNPNAVEGSVHERATTVDITYWQFAAADTSCTLPDARLKARLASVLEAMRAEGKLWVKHERRQPCFHITARERTQPST